MSEYHTRNLTYIDQSAVYGATDDFFRLNFGFYWQASASAGAAEQFEFAYQYAGTPTDLGRRPDDIVYGVVEDPPGSMFTPGIRNIYKADNLIITTTGSTSIFPVYNVPFSIEALPDPTDEGDGTYGFSTNEEWQHAVAGGTYRNLLYPGMINTKIYSISNFSFETEYNDMVVEAMDPLNESQYLQYGTECIYNRYSQKYQSNALAASSITQIPNFYSIAYNAIHGPALQSDTIADFISYNGDFVLYDTMPPESGDDDPAEGEPIVFESVNLPYPALDESTETSSDADSDTILYEDKFKRIRDYYYQYSPPTSELSDELNNTTRNIIFDTAAVEFMESANLDYVEYLPYAIRIGLPRHFKGATDGSEMGTTDNPLCNTIDDSENENKFDFSHVFLKEIKDKFVYQRDTLPSNDYAIQVEHMSLKDPESTEPSETITLSTNSIKFIDIVDTARRYSNSGVPSMPGETRGCHFVGAQTLSIKAAKDYSGTFRYVNKISADATLKKIKEELLSTERESDAPNVFELLKTESPSDFFRASEEMQESECFAFRIEKTDIDDGDTQNIIIRNRFSVGAPDPAYYDTQVKYGRTYNYNTYAYFAVVGYRYRYKNVALSRILSRKHEVTFFEDDDYYFDSEEEHPFVCSEFYTPETGLATVSPMKIDVDNPFWNRGDGGAYDVPRRVPVTEFADTDIPTAAQELHALENTSGNPYYADFILEVEPTFRLFEVQISADQRRTVLDHPPPKIDVVPYQRKDDSQIIGFYTKLENFAENTSRYPMPLDQRETEHSIKYMLSYNMIPGSFLQKDSVSRPRYIEIYRLSSKPSTISDFEGALVTTRDLKITATAALPGSDDKTYISPCDFYEEKLSTNHKFYYIFRYLNELDGPGPWSHVQEVELVNDGGYKYAKFETHPISSLKEEVVYNNPNQQAKKLLKIMPNIQHLTFDDTAVDYTADASTQIENITIGSAEESLWGKVFKLRLTSKKTGKKIDLNITYNEVRNKS